jgi:phosphatidylglycerol:prolipoprotein diacylglycerol transferase
MYPVLFDIFGIEVRSYDALALLGALSGFAVLFFSLRLRPAKVRNNTLLFALMLFIPFIAGAFLGSALPYIISRRQGWQIGETSLMPGLAVAAAFSFLMAKMLGLNAREAGDSLAAPIALGLFFARIGCLLNGCCFGTSCPHEFPFPLMYPAGSPAAASVDGPVYPVPLFEALWWMIIFFALSASYRRRWFAGSRMLMFFILYAPVRIMLDFYRQYTDTFSLAYSLFWSILAMLLSIYAFIYWQKSR